ncbi:MAG TPA: ABC transporter permease [Candidatus Acidoferrum sp.]|nr:ABC transporter permease [Candidatus Acidoferrum sp.]
MQHLQQHLKFAARQLRRNPGFTATVMITLALAIGANTAIFSLVNALIFERLPYSHPERMGTIYARVTGTHPSDEQTGIDGERWELLRDNVPALISAATGGWSGVNLRAGAHVDYTRDGRVSAHYFDVLGLRPFIGRNFTEQEDRPGGPKVAILSFRLWRSVFGEDPNILGKSIDLKREPFTVIGVLPQGSVTPLNADLYTSLQPSREGEGGGTNFDVITRLLDGASWQQADAQINRAWAALAQDFEKRRAGSHITFYSVPLQRAETDSLRPQVLGLMLAAGLILLIACANLAGLTLVRVLRRTPEIATRLALGASTWQIQKQFWSENLLLAIIGGAVGIGVGFAALHGLLLLLPRDFLPVQSVSLDARVLSFTLALSVLTSILFGMLPALAARKTDIRSSMGGRSVAAGGVRLRQILIASEVAVTVVLLAASGLLIRTLVHLETLPRGFNPNGVMIAKASLDDARYHDPAAFQKLLDESTAQMRRIPGVVDAAVGLSVPYETVLNEGVTLSDGKHAGEVVGTDVIYATPGYFHTLLMPLLAGRVFTVADGPNAQHVAIVNQTFARKFYAGASPVGHYLNKDTLVVGEVTDVPISSRLDPVAPLEGEETMYVPAAQLDGGDLALIHTWFQPDWIVRTAGPVRGLTAEIQRALSSADPDLPASGFYSMGDLLARTLAMQRIEVALLGVMAGLALMLSAVGIFALVANMVTQRTREIGIRMALGSTIAQAMLQIGRAGLGAAFIGLALGFAASAGALQVMRDLLYGVGVYDIPTLIGVAVVLSCVALAATVLPTLRIASIDPAMTLREE